MLSLLFTNPLIFLFVAAALIISISVHEFAHALVAFKLGDPTAKYMGRVTLNPLAHLDPIGTLALLFIGLGWGRPVPFNPINLSNPKRDSALIAFAGPFSNCVMAGLFAFLTKVFLGTAAAAGSFLHLVVYYNLALGVFNLIPLHPLDGFKVVYGFLPTNLAWQWQQTERYGIFILMMMIFLGLPSVIVYPLVEAAAKILGV